VYNRNPTYELFNQGQQMYLKNLLLSALLCFISFSSYAADKGVSVHVNLSPAGSFQVTTDKVRGKIIQKGQMYGAKQLYVRVKDLKTGIELRDKHMKKRLNPKKNPKIIVSKVLAKGGKGKGIIEIKGIKKPIKFVYSVSGKIFSAKFKLNLDHFKVKDLKYLGVGAKKIVEVTANVPIK
jgi:hypothetical protein